MTVHKDGAFSVQQIILHGRICFFINQGQIPDTMHIFRFYSGQVSEKSVKDCGISIQFVLVVIIRKDFFVRCKILQNTDSLLYFLFLLCNSPVHVHGFRIRIVRYIILEQGTQFGIIKFVEILTSPFKPHSEILKTDVGCNVLRMDMFKRCHIEYLKQMKSKPLFLRIVIDCFLYIEQF